VSDEEGTLLALLVAADDPIYSEMPGGFEAKSFERRLERFAAFAASVQEALGSDCPAETWPRVQDASFVGDVSIPPRLLATDEVARVVVSHFGDFAAMSDGDGLVSPETLAMIKSVVEEHEYVWMPGEVLNRPYTGANRGVSGFRTWRDRYFDWI
jgi:hypothetical protein